MMMDDDDDEQRVSPDEDRPAHLRPPAGGRGAHLLQEGQVLAGRLQRSPREDQGVLQAR